MKKRLAVVGIVVFFITYSVGLAVFGDYGIRNHNAYIEHIQELEEIQQDLEYKKSELEREKELLQNSRYVMYASQRYGYVFGEQTIVYHEQDPKQPAITVPNLPDIEQRIHHVNTEKLVGAAFAASLLSMLLVVIVGRYLKRGNST